MLQQEVCEHTEMVAWLPALVLHAALLHAPPARPLHARPRAAYSVLLRASSSDDGGDNVEVFCFDDVGGIAVEELLLSDEVLAALEDGEEVDFASLAQELDTPTDADEPAIVAMAANEWAQDSPLSLTTANIAETVRSEGAAHVPGVLSVSTAAALREYILAELEAEPTASSRFSSVLAPSAADDDDNEDDNAPQTRWDLRLPVKPPAVRDALADRLLAKGS